MQTVENIKHVAPGEGRAIWLAGELLRFKLDGHDTDGKFLLAEEWSPPGGGPPLHVHRREDEVFCVQEGEYEFTLGRRTVRAGAGSVVYGPRGVPHAFTNVGAEPARMLTFVTPASLEDFLVEAGDEAGEGRPAPPFGPPEVERLRSVAAKYDIDILAPPVEKAPKGGYGA